MRLRSWWCLIGLAVLWAGGCGTQPEASPSMRAGARPIREPALLCEAVATGDFEQVRSLLAAGADVDANDDGGETPLHIAVRLGRADHVELLLRHGANPNGKDGSNWGWTPLCAAANRVDKRIVQLLVAAGADVNRKSEGYFPFHTFPLHEAVAGRCADEVVTDLLAKRYPDVNEADDRYQDLYNDMADEVMVDLAAFLLAHGANVDAVDDIGATALTTASAATVPLLIAHGADVNHRDNECGNAPMHMAVSMGYVNVAAALIASGKANLNIANDLGVTPLHEAAWDGSIEMVRLLVANGADPNARDVNGNTPLHAAAITRNAELTELIASYGASLEARNNEGKTAMDCLRETVEAEGILLSAPEDRPYRIVVTDPRVIRAAMRRCGAAFDARWNPRKADTEKLEAALKSFLAEKPVDRDIGFYDPKFILSNFDKYNWEYAGVIVKGKRYMICTMNLDPLNKAVPRNGFSGGYGTGCFLVHIRFDADKGSVISVNCNL